MPISAYLQYLRFPLRTAPLLLIVIFGVLFTIAVKGGLFSVVLLVTTVSWFFKYSFAMLDDALNGKTEPPVMSAEMVNPVEQRPLGVLIVFGIVFFITWKLEASVGSGWVFAIRVLFLCAVPAMVAAMSMSGQFVSGLNPLAVFGIVFKIPLAYLGLLFVIALLWIVPAVILRVMRVETPLVFASMLFMYLWLAMMACVGGMMFERRIDLDIDVAHSPERSQARADKELERERDKDWDIVFTQLRGGAFANAGAEIRRIVEQSSNALQALRWLHARAAQLPDPKLAEHIVQLALPKLLEARANTEALDWVRERLRFNPNFRPTQAALLLRLASLARDGGERGVARILLQDFDRYFPNDAAAAMATRLRADLSRE